MAPLGYGDRQVLVLDVMGSCVMVAAGPEDGVPVGGRSL
jgi:hypothetical protein